MLLRKNFFGDVAWVTVGNLFRTGCVFVGWTFLARILGAEGLGVFSFAFAIMNLVASLSEFGLGVGIVKFVAAEKPGTERVKSLLRVGFWLRTALALAFVFILIISSKWLAVSVMKNAILHRPIIFAAIGTLAATHFTYILSAYQSLQRFKVYGMMSFFSGITLISGFTILYYINGITVEYALLVASIAFLLPAIFGQYFLGCDLTKYPTHECWNETRSIFSFSRWVLLGSIIVLVIMQADTLILTKFSTLEQVGSYSASLRLALSISVLSNSVLTVAMPKILKKSDHLELRKSFNFLVKCMPAFLIIYCFAFFVSPWIVKYAFGSGFEESVLTFRILFGAFLLSSITNVINYFGYGINKPEIVSFSLLIQLVILIVVGSTFVPCFGAQGMASAVLVSRIVGFFFIVFFVCRTLRRKYAIHNT